MLEKVAGPVAVNKQEELCELQVHKFSARKQNLLPRRIRLNWHQHREKIHFYLFVYLFIFYFTLKVPNSAHFHNHLLSWNSRGAAKQLMIQNKKKNKFSW